MVTRTKYKVTSDLVQREIDEGYHVVSAKVRNVAGAALTIDPDDLIGQPLKLVTGVYQFVLDGDEANATALIIRGDRMENVADTSLSETEMYILVRGPMVIRESGIATLDVAGDALDKAAVATALKGLSPPVVALFDDSPSVEASF